jgi:hydroxypyruvate reductase
MSDITVLALGPLQPQEFEQLERTYRVVKLWKEPDPEQTLHTLARDVRAVVSLAGGRQLGVSAKMIAALPNLEIIAQFGVGYDNIDVGAAKDRQIAVTNTPDVLTADTADTAMALLLGVARRVPEGDMYIRAGQWPEKSFPKGTSLSGKTVGIVGLGRIGSAIAKRCAAFDMTVVYHGRAQKPDAPYEYYPDLTKMAGAVDFLVVATAGGDGTKGLISRAVIAAMSPRAILVNIARGSVVDENALVEALVNRKIGGAGPGCLSK